MLTILMCLADKPDVCKRYDLDAGGIVACAYLGQSQVVKMSATLGRYKIKEWKCK